MSKMILYSTTVHTYFSNPVSPEYIFFLICRKCLLCFLWMFTLELFFGWYGYWDLRKVLVTSNEADLTEILKSKQRLYCRANYENCISHSVPRISYYPKCLHKNYFLWVCHFEGSPPTSQPTTTHQITTWLLAKWIYFMPCVLTLRAVK